jgi:hypothetical protein
MRVAIITAALGTAVGWLVNQLFGEVVSQAVQAPGSGVRRLVRSIFRRESDETKAGAAVGIVDARITRSSFGAQGGGGYAGGGDGGTGIGGPGRPGGPGGNIYLAPGSPGPPGASGGGGGGVIPIIREDGSVDLVGQPGDGGSGGTYLPRPDAEGSEDHDAEQADREDPDTDEGGKAKSPED